MSEIVGYFLVAGLVAYSPFKLNEHRDALEGRVIVNGENWRAVMSDTAGPPPEDGSELQVIAVDTGKLEVVVK